MRTVYSWVIFKWPMDLLLFFEKSFFEDAKEFSQGLCLSIELSNSFKVCVLYARSKPKLLIIIWQSKFTKEIANMSQRISPHTRVSLCVHMCLVATKQNFVTEQYLKNFNLYPHVCDIQPFWHTRKVELLFQQTQVNILCKPNTLIPRFLHWNIPKFRLLFRFLN